MTDRKYRMHKLRETLLIAGLIDAACFPRIAEYEEDPESSSYDTDSLSSGEHLFEAAEERAAEKEHGHSSVSRSLGALSPPPSPPHEKPDDQQEICTHPVVFHP